MPRFLMSRSCFGACVLSWALLVPPAALAQAAAVNTSGALVVVPAIGKVSHANDEAYVTLTIEEQDKDKTAAASRVNRKMQQGIEIVRREDPQAVLKTHGYYTYPVYPDEQAQPRQNKARQPVAWRVGEYLDVRTRNLAGLPKTVAAAQGVLALNGLRFGLSEAADKKLEESLIAAAYADLTDRIAAVAKAMGRGLADAVLDSADFEGSGAYAPKQPMQAMSMMRAAPAQPAEVEQPNFEPGETSLSMRVVGKVRFK